MNRSLVLFLLCLLCNIAIAQDVVVSAPRRVNVDETFSISYTVEANKVSSFTLGDLPAGLKKEGDEKIKSTPVFKVVDGQSVSLSHTVITCRLSSNKIGEYVIPKAKIVIEGKTVSSREANISVTARNDVNKTINAMIAAAEGQNTQIVKQKVDIAEADDAEIPAKAIVGGNELFIKTAVNKRSVKVNEAFTVTYKVYTTQQIKDLSGKLPNMSGFDVYEIPLPDTRTFGVEHVNGKDYNTVTWCQYLLFCMVPGEQRIPAVTFNAKVVAGDGKSERSFALSAPGVTVNVEEIQNNALGYSVGVGKMNATAVVDKHEVKAGEAFSYKFVVTGVGNLHSMKEPSVSMPMSFEVFPAKITNSLATTTDGRRGSVTYDYSIVPNKEGTYIIPENTIVYYDIEKGAFDTLSTPAIDMKVLEGAHGGNSALFDYSDDQGNGDKSFVNAVISNPFFWLGVLLIIIFTAFVVFIIKDKRDKMK